ncbi:MAG TPA: hypothetical protein VFD13_04605 [Candidatus Kapabacteria bacterium]|nr:hypothetical protein [Candidatus Kapabacteria bacterium]
MKNLRSLLPTFLLACCGLLIIASCKSSSTNPPSSSGTGGGSGIGPNGGTVTSADGKVTVVIPAGALSSNQTIAISPKTDSNTCPQALGSGYDLTPNGLTFSVPAMLTLSYDTTVRSANAEFIGVAYQDDNGKWYGVTGGSVDTIHRTVTVPISHFSTWSTDLSFEINPTEEAVVFTGTTPVFWVTEVGPAAGTAAGPPVPLSNPFALEAAVWKLNGGGGNAAIGTINSAAGGGVDYSAPQQMPSPDLVTLSATITTNGQIFVVPAFLHVIAQNWKLTGQETLSYDCSHGEFFSYTDVSGGYLDIQLDAGGSGATSFPWFSDGPPSGSDALCPEGQNTSATYTLDRGQGMSLSSISPGQAYYPSSDQIFLRTNARGRDMPGYTVTSAILQATHQTINVALKPGNDYQGAIWFKNLSTTNTWTKDNGANGVTDNIVWTLTAQ